METLTSYITSKSYVESSAPTLLQLSIIDEIRNVATTNIDLSLVSLFQEITNTRSRGKYRLVLVFLNPGEEK